MKIRKIHSWDIPPRRAMKIQEELTRRIVLERPPGTIRRIAGCDVALVSSRLPDQGALEIISRLTETLPSVKALVVGVAESEWEILQYVEAGAVGYVLKDDSVEELLRHIRAARSGESIVSPEIAHALMHRLADLASVIDTTAHMAEPGALTPREQEVLQLIGQGLSNQEIAQHLVIEVGTVKNHVHSILQKLNVSSRNDAKAYLAIMESGERD